MGISEAEFSYVSDLVRKEAAIVLPPGKEYLVESRLSPLAKAEGMASISELIEKLKAPSSLVLKAKVVDALTTNETSFFRDMSPFELLEKHVLPDMIEKRKGKKSLKIWCAASSTGQEPYTIAMVIRESFPELLNWKLEIVATDISDNALAQARLGEFSQVEVNRGLPAKFLVKYFEKDGMKWKLKPIIRDMVKFDKLNLIKPFSIISGVDIVFIRNVLIYFDRETKADILGRIRGVLANDGFMFLGGAETTLNVDENFERCTFETKGSCYRISA